MTCIALKHCHDHVIISADGLAAHPISGAVLNTRQQKLLCFKDLTEETVVIGFAGAMTMFQALEAELCCADDPVLDTSDPQSLYATLLDLHDRLKTTHGFNPHPDDEPINVVEWSNFDFLLASTSGLVCRVMSMREIIEVEPGGVTAIGSGRDHAVTAMQFGQSPEEAVRYVSNINVFVGGDIKTASVRFVD